MSNDEPTPIRRDQFDQVDQAIDDVEARAEAERVAIRPAPMVEVPVVIESTRRPVILTVPLDLTQAELLEVIGWMAARLRGHIARTALPDSGLVDLTGSPLPTLRPVE